MDAVENPAASVDNGERKAVRDGKGRFLPGNRLGQGNPVYKRQAKYRRAFEDAVSEDDMADIARAMVAAAKKGDVVAARLITDYLLGKPVTPISVESTSAHPIRLLGPDDPVPGAADDGDADAD